MKKILVSGSVVFDNISGVQSFGGTGSNICYGLCQLGVSPLLFSLVGSDFKKKFGAYLKKEGVDLRVHVEKGGKTAKFFSNVNKENQRSEIWSPNAYKNIHKLPLTKTISRAELKNINIAIFAPGTPESIYKHLQEFRKFAPRALAIFDPGQMITHYSKKKFIECLKLADILILNELEYGEIKKILGADPVKFLERLGKTIIKTLGGKGSIIYKDKKVTKVKATRPKRVLDTTGAGDAYRAGLIYGLSQNKPLPASSLLGARLASKCIEYIGCQEYKIPTIF